MARKVAELNKRIKAKIAELEQDHQDKARAWARIRALSIRTSEVVQDLKLARRRVRKYRAAVEETKAELAALEAQTPDEDTPEEQELRALLDQLAGDYEEAITIRDRLLDKLDQLREKQADAQAALDAAVAESKEDREALVRMRARRKRIREARERNDRPSPNFDWAEFDCNDGTPMPEASKPAVRHLCLTVLEPRRAKYGATDVNSGYRTDSWNRHVGGESNSVHRYDLHPEAAAADSRCEKGSPREWFAHDAGKADGRGVYATFVHADNRNRIGWPDATWSG